VANLANYVQTIIRHDLGDSIIVNPDPCLCDNLLPAIRVEGRTDEILYLETPGGEVIPLPPIPKPRSSSSTAYMTVFLFRHSRE
jgi:phenylacetate-CoA ligase